MRFGRRTPPRRSDTLLELWMGEPKEDEPRPRRRLSAPVVAAVVAILALAILGLAKYAIDVLLIAVTLVGAGIVMHVLGTWLAESDLLSPMWFTTLVLAAGVGAWALFYPAEGLASVGKLVPKPVVKFIEWSESKGWGHRAFIGTGGGSGGLGADPAGPMRPAAVSPPSRPVESPGAAVSSPALTLSASAVSPRAGQPVVLTARVTGGAGWVSGGTISFYDGLAFLGEAPVTLEGGVQVANVTVSLAAGRHDIRASFRGRLGPRSDAVRIVVAR